MTGLSGICWPEWRLLQRLVGRRVAPDGKPLSSAAVARRVAPGNAPHEGRTAALSPGVPLDAVVGRQNVTTE